MNWKTKSTDRFILRFIKLHLSAPLSSMIVHLIPGIRPGTLTALAVLSGVSAGFVFGTGHAPAGGILAAIAQILDGMDGQVARLTGRKSKKGAFFDSVLDRYVDFSLLFGILLYCLRFSAGIRIGGITIGSPLIILIAALAATGSSQVSYATARAASLDLDYRRPESAGKGTRCSIYVVCGLLTPFWIHFPLIALVYLAVHPNLALAVSFLRMRGD